MPGIDAQVRSGGVQERVHDAETGLEIGVGSGIAALSEEAAEAQESLRTDGGRRAVDRLAIVERIRWTIAPGAERRQSRGAGVPVRNAVSGRDVDVVIAGRPRRTEHHGFHGSAPARSLQRIVRDDLEKLYFLSEAEHRPGEASRPRRER